LSRPLLRLSSKAPDLAVRNSIEESKRSTKQIVRCLLFYAAMRAGNPTNSVANFMTVTDTSSNTVSSPCKCHPFVTSDFAPALLIEYVSHALWSDIPRHRDRLDSTEEYLVRKGALICSELGEISEQTVVRLTFGRPGLKHLGMHLVDFRCSLSLRIFNRAQVTLMKHWIDLLQNML
jgi:hypothetical protein